MNNKARVLLADDHDLVVGAFVALLEPYFDVIGTVSDGRALIAKDLEAQPDVIVIDIGMPRLNGLDAGQKLKTMLPKTKLVVVTMNEDLEIASTALKNWASAFLLKKSGGMELIKAIHEVLAGRTYVTPRVAHRLVQRRVIHPNPDRVSELSPRQREVLQLLVEGKSMAQAARILGVTARTIAFHKYRIMDEFSLKTSADLLRFAIQRHLVSPL
jgi:DNA-binding NarL/FixJ family response regulator